MAEKGLSPKEFLDTVLVPEKESDHICWKCDFFKPVLKDSGFPPADIIGWCKKIHWPHYWCVPEDQIIKKCFAYGAK